MKNPFETLVVNPIPASVHTADTQATAHPGFSLLRAVFQIVVLAILCLQALALVVASASTQSRAQGLFNSQQRS